MEEKTYEQVKELVENFNRIDEVTQDKLLTGVKCMAFVNDLASSKENSDKETLSAQSA